MSRNSRIDLADFALFFRRLATRRVFSVRLERWITEIHNREERIFANFIQAISCPDEGRWKGFGRKNYQILGGWRNVRRLHESGRLASYVRKHLTELRMGGPRGSHRKAAHKPYLPTLLRCYCELMEGSQSGFYSRNDFENSFKKLAFENEHPPTGCGKLAAFDILERMYRDRIMNSPPSCLPITGSGELDGLKQLAEACGRPRSYKKPEFRNQLLEEVN